MKLRKNLIIQLKSESLRGFSPIVKYSQGADLVYYKDHYLRDYVWCLIKGEKTEAMNLIMLRKDYIQ